MSPGLGTESKQKKPVPSASWSEWSRTWLRAMLEAARPSEQVTMGSSRVVLNTIATSVWVRTVATWVPTGMRTVSGCGADSQKVTSARAAVGGKRRTPMSSRNFT